MMDTGSFDTDSLDGYLTGHAGGGGAVYVVLLALIAAAGLAAPLVTFPVAIRETGYLRMAGETHTLLAPATGRVLRAALTPGQTAVRGDTLLLLEETGAALRSATDVWRRLAGSQLAVTAPISGTIAVRIPLAVGSIVAAGQPIGAVVPLAPLQAEVLLDARERGRVWVGQPATIEVDGYGDSAESRVDGRVAVVGAEVEHIGGRQVTRVRVQPIPGRSNLRERAPGMVRGAPVAVRIPLGRRTLRGLGNRDHLFPPAARAADSGRRGH